MFILIVLLMFTSALFLSALQPVLAETNQKAFNYGMTGSLGPISGFTRLGVNPDNARPYITGDIQNRHGQYIGGGAASGARGSRYINVVWQYIRALDMTPHIIFGAHEVRDGNQYAGGVIYSVYYF